MQLAVGVDLYRSYHFTHIFCMHDSHQKHVARRELCKSYLTYPSLLVSVGPVSIEFVPIPTFLRRICFFYCSLTFGRNFLHFSRDINFTHT